jgi:hypothetical protein
MWIGSLLGAGTGTSILIMAKDLLINYSGPIENNALKIREKN